MHIKHLVLVFLVVVAMGAGLIAREHVDNSYPSTKFGSGSAVSQPSLSAYAPNNASDAGGARSDVDLRPLETFYSALKLLREEYVEPIKQSQERGLTYSSLRTMLDSLHDPLTRFYEPEQAKLIQEANNGIFYGIGAVIAVSQTKQDGIVEEQLVVVSTLPGSPARKAGLMTGDVISEIDGKTILPYDPFQRVEKIVKQTRNGTIDREKLPKLLEAESERINKGIGFQKAMDTLSSDGPAKEFTLTVVRAKVKPPMKIKVASAETVVDPVIYNSPSPTVGYVRVNLTNKAAETEFAEAIADFKKRKVKGVVLDLRDSPGGTMDSARAIAGRMLYDNTFYVLQLPKGKRRVVKTVAPSSAASVWSGPVVVIVNGGTAGASEAIAAALKENAFAKLVGSHTSGKSMQQTFVPLRDGSAVTITTGKYLTPKGIDYRGKGLQASVEVPATDPKTGADPQLSKAIKLLAAGKGKG